MQFASFQQYVFSFPHRGCGWDCCVWVHAGFSFGCGKSITYFAIAQKISLIFCVRISRMLVFANSGGDLQVCVCWDLYAECYGNTNITNLSNGLGYQQIKRASRTLKKQLFNLVGETINWLNRLNGFRVRFVFLKIKLSCWLKKFINEI